MTKRLME